MRKRSGGDGRRREGFDDDFPRWRADRPCWSLDEDRRENSWPDLRVEKLLILGDGDERRRRRIPASGRVDETGRSPPRRNPFCFLLLLRPSLDSLNGVMELGRRTLR